MSRGIKNIIFSQCGTGFKSSQTRHGDRKPKHAPYFSPNYGDFGAVEYDSDTFDLRERHHNFLNNYFVFSIQEREVRVRR